MLKLTLHPASYDWQFVPEAGKTFTDSGSRPATAAAALHRRRPTRQAPTVPGTLTATAPGPTQVNLSWGASTDNVGVTGYEIYRNGTLLTTKTDDDVPRHARYGNRPTATRCAPSTPPATAPATATPRARRRRSRTPRRRPSPGSLTADATGPFNVDLSWGASTDNVGVTGYEIYRNGSLLTTKSGTTHSDTTVQPGQTYSYEVRAIDAAGNRSSPTNTAIADAGRHPAAGCAVEPGRERVELHRR